MKNTSFLVVFICALTILGVTSCTDQSNQTNMAQSYIGGTIGLNAYLLPGMPPPQIHDDNTFPFSIGVGLENVGEVDVGPGTNNPFVMVRLEGINPENFGLTDADVKKVLADPIRGARRNFDGTIFRGEITTATFEPLTWKSDIHGNTPFTLRAVICYDYETISTTSICIKDDVLENIQDTSLCSLTGEKVPQNSGGPVHISSVIENPMSDNKIQINMVIEHVGTGEFFGRPVGGDDMTEPCDFSPRNMNKYYVDVQLEPLSDSGLVVTCSRFGGSSQGRVQLYQGAPITLSCTIERTRPAAGRVFQELLNVRLKYRYGQFIETPILVQDVSNN